MNITEVSIGLEVVRSKGDYVVGRIGNIIEIDSEKLRVNVDWHFANKSWVSINSVEPTSKPYEIIPSRMKDKYTQVWPKYKSI